MLLKFFSIKFIKIFPAICTSILLFSHYSYADAVEVMRYYGNTVVPVKETNIKMLKEVVNITGTSTKAVFTFENATDKEIKLEMGFPFKKIYSGAVGGIYIEGCNSFSTKINGKQVPVLKKSVNKYIKSKIGSVYDYMFTWPTVFKPKEKKVIECDYFCSRSLTDSEWKKGITAINVNYITKTGSLWEGPIGQADFYFTLDNDISQRLKKKSISTVISPKGYKIVDYKTIEWHFMNWKPTEDIRIEFYEK